MNQQIIRQFICICAFACATLTGCTSNRAAPVVDLSPAPIDTPPAESRTSDQRATQSGHRAAPRRSEGTSASSEMNAPSEPRPVTRRRPQAAPAAKRQLPAQVETKPYREGDWRPEFVTVRKGDTLYSIALDFGQDYRDLAKWNNLADPSYIQIGQQLRVFPAGGSGEAFTPEPVALAPATLPAGTKPDSAPLQVPTFSDPKAFRADYSQQAYADLQRRIADESQTAVVQAKTVTQPAAASKPVPTDDSKSVQVGRAGFADERLSWEWPAPGKVLYEFSSGPNKKGVTIQGQPGQAVVSSAPGKVVYSGSGLRGYGKLIIIKHNPTYLSVYAHNSELLVSEGQMVAQGQKIAVMGSAASGQTALHFEIRRLGKPIDPLSQLPARPS